MSEPPLSTGSNSLRSPSFKSLITLRARSRASTSWTWLVTPSAPTPPSRSSPLRVDGALGLGQLLGLGAQEHVLAPVDEDACLRLVARGDAVDGREGERGDEQGRPDHPHLLGEKGAADRA